MACERNRITKLVEYIESLGIEVNLGKNKARGNKGFFGVNWGRDRNQKYRIDISKGINEDDILRVLVHEFMHYVHFINDNKLKSAEFLFGESYSDFEEDLIKLTVDSIPKDSIKPLFTRKEILKSEILELSKSIKNIYPDFKISEPYKRIEKEIKKPARYLLKYDKVRVLEGFSFKIYSIDNVQKDFPEMSDIFKEYILLQSKNRMLKRINSKISRLNRYYNSPSELIARSFEYYFLTPDVMKIKTPELYAFYKNNIQKNKHISEFELILNN